MKIIKHKQINKPLDKLTYFVGPIIPILTIPQAYEVLISRQTAGVSLITWSFYLLSSALFAYFGIKHKEKLLVITYVPFVFIELAIVVGILVNS